MHSLDNCDVKFTTRNRPFIILTKGEDVITQALKERERCILAISGYIGRDPKALIENSRTKIANDAGLTRRGTDNRRSQQHSRDPPTKQ